MVTASGLYSGVVSHARLRPRRHRLGYRIFQLLLDLDEVDALDRRLRWFSAERFNLVSFHARDHLAGSDVPLKDQVESLLARAGLTGGGHVQLLCMPRVLGQAFNPLSLYFCHRKAGGLAAILYEVNNTFGERHAYLIPVKGGAGEIRQACDKAFYVSPFMPMALRYAFEVSPPGEDVRVAIQVSDTDGLLLNTAFAGRRAELTDRALLAAFFGTPLLALKVLAAIHWEGLRTWLKGSGFHRRPPPPEQPVTVVG